MHACTKAFTSFSQSYVWVTQRERERVGSLLTLQALGPSQARLGLASQLGNRTIADTHRLLWKTVLWCFCFQVNFKTGIKLDMADSSLPFPQPPPRASAPPQWWRHLGVCVLGTGWPLVSTETAHTVRANRALLDLVDTRTSEYWLIVGARPWQWLFSSWVLKKSNCLDTLLDTPFPSCRTVDEYDGNQAGVVA
jgi:hypothetical protein